MVNGRFSIDAAQITAFEMHPIERTPRRRIEAAWPLDGQAHGESGHYLKYSAIHAPLSKALSADVRVVKIEHEGMFTSESFSISRGERVAVLRVPRYSKKLLQTFFDQHIGSTLLEASIEQVLANESLSAA